VNAINVGATAIKGLFDDQVGVCLNCGTLADPVPNQAKGQRCEACGRPCLVGIAYALEIGAIRVNAEFAA
jgi:hypothetical protein